MEIKYYNNEDHVKEYIALTNDIDNKWLLSQLYDTSAKNSRLLELGSGPGNDLAELKAYFKVVGSDHSELFLTHLKQRFPTIELLNLDAETLITDQKFDLIYSNKVLHHLSPEKLVKSLIKQLSLLNKGGKIAHTFWHGTGSETYNDMPVHLYCSTALKCLLHPYYQIIKMEVYQEFEPNDSLLMIAQKV